MGHKDLCLQTSQPVNGSFKLGKMGKGRVGKFHADRKIRLNWAYLQQVHAAKEKPTRHDYGVSSCTLPGRLNTSLKCLHNNACSMGINRKN